MNDVGFKEFSEAYFRLADKLKEDKSISLVDRIRPLQ